MFRKNFEFRHKLPIINGLLAMIMMLGTFSVAYAQGGNTQVLLPLVHNGLNEEEFLDNSSELQAAGSCYGEAFWMWTQKSGGVYVTPKIHVWSEGGSFCSDVNINTASLYPRTGCMSYEVHIYDSNGNWMRWTGKNRVCRYPQKWKTLATNLRNDESYRITFYQNPTAVKLAD